MTSNRIMLLSSIFLVALMHMIIAANITHVFFKSPSINCTLLLENEALLEEKATSKMNEIGVKKAGTLGLNNEREENSNITMIEFALFVEIKMNPSTMDENPVDKDGETNKDKYSSIQNMHQIKCNISTDCNDLRMQCLNETCFTKCNNTADCGEDPRVTCRKALCRCSRFHFRDRSSGQCIPNVTRILEWSRKSASTESVAESQPSAFKVKQLEPYTVLEPIWAEYKSNEDIGLGFIPTPVWAVAVCIGLLFLIYSLIIFDLL